MHVLCVKSYQDIIIIITNGLPYINHTFVLHVTIYGLAMQSRLKFTLQNTNNWLIQQMVKNQSIWIRQQYTGNLLNLDHTAQSQICNHLTEVKYMYNINFRQE